MSQKHLTDQRFADLDLNPALLQGIEQAGFEFLTPIQAGVLPLLLQQQDVAGQAQTGTGKTAAFLIAAYTRLLQSTAEPGGADPRALMLAPTRELAIQIHKDAETLGGHLQFRLALAYGGTGYETQRRHIREGIDVLIGTPGRIIDYYKQGIFGLGNIEVMVLDEADRMFDLGFIRDIRYVLRRMPSPEKRLNMMFSATLSLRVAELAYEHMNNPQTVKIESEFLTVDQVEQRVYFPANEEKISLLIALLKQIDPLRTLVFVNTKHMAESLEGWLSGNGYKSGVLSGDVPQTKRERLLQEFKQGELPLLIATDVAARGLHIPDVSHVINFDLPQDPEDYVHRVGRTARAGASGDAISFACETHAFSLAEIEEFIGKRIPTARIEPGLLKDLQPPRRTQFEGKRTRQSNSANRSPKSGQGKIRPRRKEATPRPPAAATEQEITPREPAPAAGPVVDNKVELAPARPSPVRRREIPAVG